jgi:hypothetical protein
MGAKKDHPESSSGFMSRMRRTFLRNAPTTMLQEMRPMLNRNAKAREEAERGRGKARVSFLPDEDMKNSLGIKDGRDAFEFSVRDHSDATAKRGFRVQVPKRMICYTVLVFFVLPIFLFVYVEMHKHSLKKQAARYHTFDITKVLPHILDDILPDDELESNSTSVEDEGDEVIDEPVGGAVKDDAEGAEDTTKPAEKESAADAPASEKGDGATKIEDALISNKAGLGSNATAFSMLALTNASDASLIKKQREDMDSELKVAAEEAESGTQGRLLRPYERLRGTR